MNTLIGVMTCRRRQDRANSQRVTWAKDSVLDVRFFVGSGYFNYDDLSPYINNCVILDCPDDYGNLTLKVIEMCKWALDNNYEYLWKLDDDVYVRPERLIGIEEDYYGFVCNLISVDGIMVPTSKSFCMGPIYGLSRKAMEVIVNSEPTTIKDKKQEDEWVGKTLIESGIVPTHTDLIRQEQAYKRIPIEDWVPMITNDIISSAEWENEMWVPHQIWLNSVGEDVIIIR
jgi:hypothetical protein